MIYLATTAASIAGAAAQINDNRQWISGAELRIDLLSEQDQGQAPALRDTLLSAGSGSAAAEHLPLIATCRRESDGGRSASPDAERLSMLVACAERGFTQADIEVDLITSGVAEQACQAVSEAGTGIIVSDHDFQGVPDTIDELIAATKLVGRGAVLKLAATPQSTSDLVRLITMADLLRDQDIDHIILGMGPFGFPTRVLTHRMGNRLTFASVVGEAAAPGHVTPQMLRELYRIDLAGHATRYFAVIGNPIGHSRSPHYHNARFADDGIDAMYLPVLVDDVAALVSLADQLPLLGCSVTIPHKQDVIAHLTEAGEDVQAAGACNTMVRAKAGWRGINTDVIGFLAPLEEVLGSELSDCTVLVLGAGGASRGIVYGLLRAGATVQIWNRTGARAQALVEELSRFDLPGVASLREDDDERAPDVLVNTTSVGMHGEGDPAQWLALTGSEIVYDIVYTPPETPLITRAVAAGCRVVTGDRMFDAQAAAQFELYRVLATAGLDADERDPI